jgi:hypothetical protein
MTSIYDYRTRQEKVADERANRIKHYNDSKREACWRYGKCLSGRKQGLLDQFLIKAKGGLTDRCYGCESLVLKDCVLLVTMYRGALTSWWCRDCIDTKNELHVKLKGYNCPRGGACQALHITRALKHVGI